MSFDLRKHRKIIIAVVAGIALLTGLMFLWQVGDSPNETDRIYTNVYIHGVAVGGMNPMEANAALMERFQAGLEARVVRYAVEGDVKYAFTFAEFGARFDFAPLIDTALAYSHAPSFGQRVTRVFRNTYEITESPIFIFSAERLESIMRELSVGMDTPVQNAAFREENGEISVVEETVGQGIDTVLAAEATQNILQSLTDGIVELQLISIQPTYTTEHFNFTPTLLGTFETPCACANDEARCRNIIRAAGKINNTVLYSGSVFSAGELIGAHLPNSGYEPAVVMIRGEPAEDIGGGVCQVVTTLYNAVLRSELQIIQRHNHSARVSYVDIGYDATVAGNYFDLKFKNNTDSPILITSRVDKNMLTVSIFGKDTREDGRTVRFEVRQVELLPPEPYREVIDPTIPRGIRQVTLESQMGYHVELFKIVYMDGKEIDQIKINSSVYKPLQGVIAIGAG
ncbi:MAG: VanW family protein [Defluviitaleaceae bacterium]|nr:VanW family protein [Defluviitaleaceae bacterium]MCL2261803.1 VanW family protein [Defluviitaleaceae bacterium]